MIKLNSSFGQARKTPYSETGCLVNESGKHNFQMYGKSLETCIFCKKEHSLVTEYRKMLANPEIKELIEHPFIKEGWLSVSEYKKMMKNK